MLEKELGELKKYVNMDNYTGKIRSAFENNDYITCTNVKVAFGFFQFALKYLNEINTGHNEILKVEYQRLLDYSDIGIIFGYRFREVNDSKKSATINFMKLS